MTKYLTVHFFLKALVCIPNHCRDSYIWVSKVALKDYNKTKLSSQRHKDHVISVQLFEEMALSMLFTLILKCQKTRERESV